MPSITKVAIAGGAGFTAIPCNIPAHYVKIKQDEAETEVKLEVQFPADAYATTHTYKAADLIELFGAGAGGIIAKPKDMMAVGFPAASQNYCKIHAADNSAIHIRLEEYEQQKT